jgi:hypothetical protein
MTKPSTIAQIQEQWQQSWSQAKLVWSPYVKLREPQWCLSSKDAAKEGLTGSFAMIRLNDHRIVIDLENIHHEGVENFALEVLAHEIGHHIYTPANLHDNASMLSRIRWGLADIENRAPFVANIYADLLINDTLQRTKDLNIAGVYQQINKTASFSNLWMFYMRTYEYLWKTERGVLASQMDLHSPRIDADASLAASLIRSYSKKWLDGAGRFAALMYPYLLEEEEYQKARQSSILILDAETAGEYGGTISGMASIDMEGMMGAIDPRLEASRIEGKVGSDTAAGYNPQGGEGPKQGYLSPSKYIDFQRQLNPKVEEQELLNNYYKEIALPHLIDFPLETATPTSLALPEGTESWDTSDPVDEIDWIETTINTPIIVPGFNTLKRLYGPDDSESDLKKPLDVYLGLDCSGSMGNPRIRFSWPVLAATIIGLSALRAGAKVMGCLSGEPGSFMETDGFVTSEKDLLTLLTSYLGTGYAYGIPRLVKPFGQERRSKSHVIIVTDQDLFSMLAAKKEPKEESNWVIIERALKNAGGIGTLVLHLNPGSYKPEITKLEAMGWHVYYVTNEEQLLKFSAEFSKNNYQFKTH